MNDRVISSFRVLLSAPVRLGKRVVGGVTVLAVRIALISRVSYISRWSVKMNE